MRIGVITNSRNGVFQRAVIAGATSAISEYGGELIVDATQETDSLRLKPTDADGFLVVANAASPDFLHALHTANKPVTLVSHAAPDLPFPAVVSDNRQGILALVRHLVFDCRRAKLVFVRGIMDQYDARQREAAFQEALLRYRIPSEHAIIIDGEFDPKTAVHALLTEIEQGKRFNAVVSSDYLMACAIVDTLRLITYKVPQKVAVVGFGDGKDARKAGLTTVAADVEELGRRGARQLIHQINGATITGVTTLSVRLIVRETSAAPPHPVKREA